MTVERLVIPGVVKQGVVVPESGVQLPEGSHVSIVMAPAGIPVELWTELESWERAGDEAWGMIDQWEKEDRRAAG